MKINWRQVWKEFAKLTDRREERNLLPDWNEQKKIIKYLVNKQVNAKPDKRKKK